MLQTAFNYLWKQFQVWANEAKNWLYNFFSKVFDWIANWFDAICDYIEELLSQGDEAIVLDTRTSIGKEIYQTIVEQCPKTTSIRKFDRTGKIVLGSENQEITKVENFQAGEIEDTNTDFDRQLASEGLIRITE